MNMSVIGLILSAIASNVIASLLLKKSAISSHNMPFYEMSIKLFSMLGLALMFYAVAFVVYAALLRTLPVGKAYGLITFGSQIMLIVAGSYFFGEEITPAALIGIILIAVGLVLISRQAIS